MLRHIVYQWLLSYDGSDLVSDEFAASDANGYYDLSHMLPEGTYTIKISDGTYTDLVV